MAATEHRHAPTPEEIMEYLDGEGTVASRGLMEGHLAECGHCQVLAREQRRLSETFGGWEVGRAPASLRAPAGRRRRLLATRFTTWRRPLLATLVAAGAAAAVLLAISLRSEYRLRRISVPPEAFSSAQGPDMSGPQGEASDHLAMLPERSPEEQREQMAYARQLQPLEQRRIAAQDTARKPSVVRTTTLRIVARDFDAVRPAVESVVAAAGGFLDRLTATGGPGSVRALHGTLRIPSDRLGEVSERLRQLGQVVEDTQRSEDVSDQLVDLDARLASARTTERRLVELLRSRTGTLSDVLNVERELARVRIDVERLDAETTNIGRRVSYATVIIDIAEERKAGLTPGPLSFASRVRTAAADGVESALESAAWTLLSLLRAGPILGLWALVLGSAWLIFRRARARRTPGLPLTLAE